MHVQAADGWTTQFVHTLTGSGRRRALALIAVLETRASKQMVSVKLPDCAGPLWAARQLWAVDGTLKLIEWGILWAAHAKELHARWPRCPSFLALITFLLASLCRYSPFFSCPAFKAFSPDQFDPQNPPVQPRAMRIRSGGLIYVWLIVGWGWGLWSGAMGLFLARHALCAGSVVFCGCFWLRRSQVGKRWGRRSLIEGDAGFALTALFRSHARIADLRPACGFYYAGWLSATFLRVAGTSCGAGYGWNGAADLGDRCLSC